MFEGPISNNKENINIVNPPPLRHPCQKYFFQISFVNMEVLMFKFEGSIPINKINRNLESIQEKKIYL